MRPLLAITALTVKAAFRFRLVLLVSVLLLGGVAVLPMVIEHDGSARGFAQIILTYTLSLTTALLGFVTLWLGCGTLARDVEECQIQMVAVKPISRWQIWLGKWLGILAVNAMLLALAGGLVYGTLQWRARQLSPDAQKALSEQVMVARAAAREPIPDMAGDIERVFQMRLKETGAAGLDQAVLRRTVTEQVKAQYQVVPPDHYREWKIDLGWAKDRLRDQPLFLQFKFNVAAENPSKTYLGFIEVGDQGTSKVARREVSVAADTFHQIVAPPGLFNEQGILNVRFSNYDQTAMFFSLEDGMEVLYREGGFALNFVRALAIIFFWLAFLGALGLAAASFLSFPVAAFVAIGVLIVGMSSGTISLVLEQGTVLEVNHETGMADAPALIDLVALPVFKFVLHLINMVKGFSPIDSLSSGRSITWSQLGQAFLQICVLLSGLLCLFGIGVFQRRELATAQGTH